MTELPRGTATFLFGDIEASTQLTPLLAEAFAGVRRKHRSLVRAAIAEHGGHEIDTEGDGFFVAFERGSRHSGCGKVEFGGIDIHRIEHGRIVEEWTSWDALALIRELGLVEGEQ